MTSRIRLLPARENQFKALENLLQLYLYDFEDFLDEEGPDENGWYDPGFEPERYMNSDHFWAYLGWVDRKLAGFALVSDRVEQRKTHGHYVDEFFVLRRYRRQGIGSTLAAQLFDTHLGYWEVTVVGPNTPAQAFWRKVVNEYSKGRYQDFTIPENGMDIIWLTFDNNQP